MTDVFAIVYRVKPIQPIAFVNIASTMAYVTGYGYTNMRTGMYMIVAVAGDRLFSIRLNESILAILPCGYSLVVSTF